jgi:Glycerophosphoryl diester phosphodiesterase family
VYAQQFFKVENATFNMLQWALMGPLGSSFIKKAQRLKRAVFAWTVNEEKNMYWCIEHKLDGVISDDPKKFLEACDAWEEEPRPVRWTLREWLGLLRFQLLIGIYFFIFRWRVGSGVDKKYLQSRSAKAKKAQ